MFNWLNNAKFAIMQKSLDALWLRQKVISNNIANIDTPGYKSKYVLFEDMLDEAMFWQKGNAPVDVSPKIVADTTTSIREDGNNVDIDAQNLEMARTQIQYEYMIRKISDEFAKLRYVINEGRR